MPHNTVLTRIRAEYLEMPGMQLTLEQAQRLCGVERDVCRRVLEMLVAMKFLCVKPNGVYGRVTDGTDGLYARAAKADLRTEPAKKAS